MRMDAFSRWDCSGMASIFSYVTACCIPERVCSNKRSRRASAGDQVPSSNFFRGASRCLPADRKSASPIKVVCWSHPYQSSAPSLVHWRALCDLLAELGSDLAPDKFPDESYQSAGTQIPRLLVYASCNDWLELGSQLTGEELLIPGLPLPCCV